MTTTKYKIINNYLKYIAYDDINYINKIISLIGINNNYFQVGGLDENENENENENIDIKSNYKKLDFVIKNLQLIIEDIELFNKILSIIKKHDELMSEINSKYEKFNYDDNILNYLDKLIKKEFIFF